MCEYIGTTKICSLIPVFSPVFTDTYSYTQDLPSRFIKEVVKAADENKDGMIDVEELQHLLTNIGSQDQLSRQEIESMIHTHFGPDTSQVPVDVVIQRFLDRIRRGKDKKKV